MIMSKIRKNYDEDFRKNAVKLSYATTKTTKESCHPSLIYRWRRKYTEQGDKTKVATQHEELRKLQLENTELKMENEMQKKQRPTLRNIGSKISLCPRESRISQQSGPLC
jgi:transposase